MRSFLRGLWTGLGLIALVTVSVEAQSRLIFPRLSGDPGTITGVAVVNPGSLSASLAIIAFGKNGAQLGTRDELAVEASSQLSLLTSELFPGLAPETVGWIEVISPADDLTGFFLFLDPQFLMIDGADLPQAASEIVFNQLRTDSGFATELNIVNPEESEASLQLQLVGAESGLLSRELTLAPKGVCRLDVRDFFGDSAALLADEAYVKVVAPTPVAGFQLVFLPEDGVLGLNARPLAERLNEIYFPQLAVLGPWQMEIGLQNYSDQDVVASIWVLDPDGVPYGADELQSPVSNPQVVVIEAGSGLREDVSDLFGFQGSEQKLGWVRVVATSQALNGYVTYGVPSFESTAAVASVRTGRTRSIFSHIATVQDFFTGVAVLNPSALATALRILAMTREGVVLGRFDTVLQPGQRISQRLTELIPQAAGQNGGFIWIRSQFPVFLTSIFGPLSSVSIANVPPQPAPETFQPDAGISFDQLNPSFSILPPGGTLQFATPFESDFSWSVNGKPGGNSASGTVSSSGLYQAPVALPTPQVVSVTATDGSTVVGASVDVLGRVAVLSGLEATESIAYLSSLAKLYAAELRGSGAGVSGERDTRTPGAQSTAVSEIDFSTFPLPTSNELLLLDDDEVADMIPFMASNGRSFLLLASRNLGRVLRVDPLAPADPTEVASGLNGPEALVIDPTSGHLLVAESDRIGLVDRVQLEVGLIGSTIGTGVPATLRTEPPVLRRLTTRLRDVQEPTGLAVDECTGRIYYSTRSGLLVEFDRAQNSERLVLGLEGPSQLQGFYRNGLACPGAFQLLVIEEEAGQTSLIWPDQETVIRPWSDSPGGVDLAFSPEAAPGLDGEGVFVAGRGPASASNLPSGVAESDVSFIRTLGLYRDTAMNPPHTDLGVQEPTSPDFVLAGSETTFSVVITNEGPLDGRGVGVLASPSEGMNFVSGGPGNCQLSNGVLTCLTGFLPVGAEETVFLNAVVGASQTDTIGARISVFGSLADLNSSNDSLLVETTVLPQADLRIEKVGPGVVNPGGRIEYSIVVSNQGPSEAVGAVLMDPTPDGLTFVSSSGGCDAVDVCALGTLGPGTERAISALFDVPIDYVGPNPIVNTASVTSETSEAVPGNESASTSTAIEIGADLVVEKVGPGFAVAGAEIPFSITVRNNGPNAAEDVRLEDLPSPSLTLLETDCTTLSPCELGALPVDGFQTFIATYRLAEEYDQETVSNQATVSSSTPEASPGDEESVVDIVVETLADLNVVKAGPGQVSPGEMMTFVMMIRNDGPSVARDVVLSDPVPDGLTLVSTSEICDGIFPCDLGTLAVGEIVEITASFEVPESYDGSDLIVNTATVSSSTSDPQDDNNANAASVALVLPDQNEPPEVSEATFSIPEDSSNGGLVGVVMASDPDPDDTLNYLIIGGNASGAFGINFSTGSIRVADSSALDFESRPQFVLTVRVTDNGGLSDSAPIIVNITNVNEPPTLQGATLSVDENSSKGTSAGTVSAVDPDSGDTLSYSIIGGNTGGAFSIAGGTGQITVSNTQVLNFEAIPTFSLTVRVEDSDGLSDAATVNVNLNDVNEPPRVDNQTFHLTMFSPGTLIGTVAASDPDAGDSLTWVITSGVLCDGDPMFSIDGKKGHLILEDPACLVSTNVVTVRVTDSRGLFDSAIIQVLVQIVD